MSNVVKKEKHEAPAISMQDALVEIVQRKDIDPDRLEKFLDLQIKMEDRQAEKSFQAALAEFQKDCPVIAKTRKIDFASKSGSRTKYNYSPLDEIVSIIKPILAKWGLSYSFNIKPFNEDQSELVTTIYHKDGHRRDFSYFFFPLHDDMRMNQSQRAKSSITYAKRSGLENALGIVTTEEDDDARRAIDREATPKQIEQINELMLSTKTELKNFLSHMKVDRLDKLSEHEAKRGIRELKQKRARS